MIEIERKFLVRNMAWGDPLCSRRIEQGYLFIAEGRSMRVRRSDDDYTLTLKVRGDGLGRHEIETDIDGEQGRETLDNLCVGWPVKKTRYDVLYEGKRWEIDVFDGANAGLIMAEIELESEDESFALPDWVGPEVTGDTRFFNAALSNNPFSEWGVTYSELVAEKSAAAT